MLSQRKVPSLIVAIDAGFRNLGVVAIRNGNWREPAVWRRESLTALKKPSEEALYQAIYGWCNTNAALLQEADKIVLERQMHKKFIVINTVIRTLHHSKTVVIGPSTVGAFHRLPTTRAEKKLAGTELVEQNVPIPLDGKQDDMADAMLMALWFLFQEHPETAEGWNERERKVGRVVFGGRRAGAGGNIDSTGPSKRQRPDNPGTTGFNYYTGC